MTLRHDVAHSQGSADGLPDDILHRTQNLLSQVPHLRQLVEATHTEDDVPVVREAYDAFGTECGHIALEMEQSGLLNTPAHETFRGVHEYVYSNVAFWVSLAEMNRHGDFAQSANSQLDWIEEVLQKVVSDAQFGQFHPDHADPEPDPALAAFIEQTKQFLLDSIAHVLQLADQMTADNHEQLMEEMGQVLEACTEAARNGMSHTDISQPGPGHRDHHWTVANSLFSRLVHEHNLRITMRREYDQGGADAIRAFLHPYLAEHQNALNML